MRKLSLHNKAGLKNKSVKQFIKEGIKELKKREIVLAKIGLNMQPSYNMDWHNTYYIKGITISGVEIDTLQFFNHTVYSERDREDFNKHYSYGLDELFIKSFNMEVIKPFKFNWDIEIQENCCYTVTMPTAKKSAKSTLRAFTASGDIIRLNDKGVWEKIK